MNKLFLLALSLTLAACGGSSDTTAPQVDLSQFAGNYNLISVNGMNLPVPGRTVTLHNGQATCPCDITEKLTEGTLTVLSDGKSWQRRLVVDDAVLQGSLFGGELLVPTVGQDIRESSGVIALSGNQIMFMGSGNATMTGTNITIVGGDWGTMAYQKQ